MITLNPAAERGIRQLDQMLTHYIGPMAKIVLARALKTARDDTELVRVLAGQIDAEAERAAFVMAATRALAADPVIPPERTQSPAAETPPVAAAPAEPREPARPAPPPPRADPAPDAGAMKAGAIFISYARHDLPVAKRIAHALHAGGLEVWLDFGNLQPGDAWDIKIRRNIELCSFFVPLISQTTETRQEGYFRREWNIAADRALNFADDVPFIVPVTIDHTSAYSARVPERFRRAHWISLPQGEVTGELIDRLKELLADYRASR